MLRRRPPPREPAYVIIARQEAKDRTPGCTCEPEVLLRKQPRKVEAFHTAACYSRTFTRRH